MVGILWDVASAGGGRMQEKIGTSEGAKPHLEPYRYSGRFGAAFSASRAPASCRSQPTKHIGSTEIVLRHTSRAARSGKYGTAQPCS